MLAKKNPVLYKKQPAIITDFDGDKILIKYQSVPATSTGKPAQYNEQKVRDKDIILLHDKEVSSLEKLMPSAFMRAFVFNKRGSDLSIGILFASFTKSAIICFFSGVSF